MSHHFNYPGIFLDPKSNTLKSAIEAYILYIWTHPHQKRTVGNRVNQQNPIKKSYRNRGNSPRIIITRKKNKKEKIKLYKKKIFEVKKQILKIKPYSPKKIKTNGPPLYSILNPLINSLSPSAKSNGARLDSAKTHKHQKGEINNPGEIKLIETPLQVIRTA